METIKRQTRAAYGWLVIGQSIAYRLYIRSVCDMNSAAAAAVCRLWHYESVICLWPGGLVRPPVRWTAMSNIEVGRTIYPANRGRVGRETRERGQSHKEEEIQGVGGTVEGHLARRESRI